MTEAPCKKSKSTDNRPARVRSTIQLEVEPGMEERLNRVKSRFQQAKSALSIHARTQLGNVIMMECLLDAFDQHISSTCLISSQSLHSFGSLQSLHGNTHSSSDASSQTEHFAHFARARGEYSNGCFEKHTAHRIDEKYFLLLYDSLQHLMETMVKYYGKCPICGRALLPGSFSSMDIDFNIEMNHYCICNFFLIDSNIFCSL